MTVLHARDSAAVMALSITGLRIEQYCCVLQTHSILLAPDGPSQCNQYLDGTQGPINHLSRGTRLRIP